MVSEYTAGGSKELHGSKRYSLRNWCLFDVGAFPALLEATRDNSGSAINRTSHRVVVHPAAGRDRRDAPVAGISRGGARDEDGSHVSHRGHPDQRELVYL